MQMSFEKALQQLNKTCCEVIDRPQGNYGMCGIPEVLRGAAE